MKKLLMLAVVAIIGVSIAFAAPVGVNTAKMLGQKFVQANFEKSMRSDLQLYYTVTSDQGEPCVYVFNMGNEGFVMVAASDNVRPILAYSEDGPFDASNPYNGAMFMLETYKNSISYAIEKSIAPTPEIAGQWESLRNCGRLSSKRGRTVGPLVQTKWNQNSPYNLYAPAASGGPGGRCYAGCVATAMSQVMKYWNHPAQGIGSHSYYCPGYGQQSANFGATTYHWDLMPITLGSASQEQIEAVATLMYHCGVAVNMGFAPDGSGAFSADVPPAMAQYFDYNYCVQRQRSSYSLDNWVALLKAEFDLGRPVYYSGQSSEGGHAFVADGYNEDDFIHFNFGWSGSDDNWYQVDAIDYHNSAAAIFNYVPSAVYQNTVQAPTNVTATRTSDVAQEATITWTNPTKFMNNQNVTSYDQIVVAREGEVIYTVNNPTPGASMTYVDSEVPCYSTFEYRVFAVKNGVNGASGVASESFGPTCQWKIVATTTNMGGWKSGYLVSYDGAGREIDRFTMTNGNPTTYNMDVILGKVSFAWKAGTDNVDLTFKIKDATGTIVYQYSGTSNDIPEGVLYQSNNTCGNATPTMPFPEVFANGDGENIILTWDGGTKDVVYGINIYRDGLLFALVDQNQNEFVDVAPSIGGHCYQLCYLTDGGDTELSNEVCGAAGEGCDPPRSLDFHYNQSNGKPIITWEAPESTDGLSGYYVYKKVNEDGQYNKVKALGPSKFEYKDSAVELDNWYYYKVVAAYESGCISAPAKAVEGNQYYVKVYYPAPVNIEENSSSRVNLYPNPTKDSFTIEAENIQNVMVYNTVGQMMLSQVCDGNNAVINLSGVDAGIYMVKVVTANGESIQKVSVIR